MLKFKDYLYSEDLLILDRLVEGVEDHQPLNGKWVRPLEPSNNHAEYKFDVPGDNCGPGCYAVNISGNPKEIVSISFSRSGSYMDQHKGVGMEVFKGVLKALSEYVSVLKPKGLSWSAVAKRTPNPKTGKIINPEARAHIYEGWATRYLFPDKYVGMKDRWLRRDIYDSEYVPKGFPPVPEGVTSDSPSGTKKEVLEKMRKEFESKKDEIERIEREHEQRRRDEEERERRAEIAAALADPEKNPEGIQEGDIVFLADPENQNVSRRYRENPAKVERIDLYSILYATVRFSNDEEIGDDFYGENAQLKITEFRKATPEAIEDMRRKREERLRREEEERRQAEERERQRQERIQARIAHPEHNPEGIKEGDIVYLNDPDNEEHRLPYDYRERPGKVERLMTGYYGHEEEGDVYATVRFSTRDGVSPSDESEFNGRQFNILVSKLKKPTPEYIADRERQRQELIANLISSEESNPNGVQEGDEVITNIPNSTPENEQNGLRGKITRFKPERDGLYAYVSWDDHAQRILWRNLGSALDVKFLHKATPEGIQRISRMRRDSEIEQQIQRNRERQNRRTQGPVNQTTGQTEEELQELINSPSNPQHLKPGDFVKVVGWQNRGRSGVIVSLEKPYLSSHAVIAYVRFHGSRAARPTRFWSLDDLERDTSQQAQALQGRQQQQRDRLERIAAATNGLQIGDAITVASGVHRGKSGRIVGFRASGQNIIAAIATHEGNFNVNARAIARETAQPVAAESLSFFRYYLDKYNEVI